MLLMTKGRFSRPSELKYWTLLIGIHLPILVLFLIEFSHASYRIGENGSFRVLETFVSLFFILWIWVNMTRTIDRLALTMIVDPPSHFVSVDISKIVGKGALGYSVFVKNCRFIDG
jgi:hypothetical protein